MVATLNTGGQIQSSTNSWTATSTTNAPDGASRHTAVWTGSEMIVWGGIRQAFEHWREIQSHHGQLDSHEHDQRARRASRHTAVWTGNEMIVWGGRDSTGLQTRAEDTIPARTWTATSTANAPEAREFHTAVWTGSEMIVWGGERANTLPLNTGGRYNPSTN